MTTLRKTNFAFVENVERSILIWLRVRKYRLSFFIFVVAILFTFSHAPYINLFLNSYLIILISVILAPFILDIDARPFFVIALALFIVTFFMWFFDKNGAETLGEYIFIILLSGVLRTLFAAEKVHDISVYNISENNKQRK